MQLERRVVALERASDVQRGPRLVIIEGGGDVATGHGHQWCRAGDEDACAFIRRVVADLPGRLPVLALTRATGPSTEETSHAT